MRKAIEWIADSQICLMDGHAWMLRDDLQTFCAGSEADVEAYLGGEDVELKPDARKALDEILEMRDEIRRGSMDGKTSGRTARHNPRTTRLPKTLKKHSVNKGITSRKSVSRKTRPRVAR